MGTVWPEILYVLVTTFSFIFTLKPLQKLLKVILSPPQYVNNFSIIFIQNGKPYQCIIFLLIDI